MLILHIKKAGKYIVEIYERIRELRKNHLHLSQTEFGDRLGVSRSVIKNIELNVLARPEQKLSLIKLICKEFSVNETWLLNGTQPMFIEESNTFSLDEFMKQRGTTDLELQLVKAYFDLDADTRKMLINHFKKVLTISTSNTVKTETLENNKQVTNYYDDIPDTAEEFEKMYPPIEMDTDKKKNVG